MDICVPELVIDTIYRYLYYLIFIFIIYIFISIMITDPFLLVFLYLFNAGTIVYIVLISYTVA